MATPEERLTTLEATVADLVVQVDNIEHQASTRIPALEVSVADIEDQLTQVQHAFEIFKDFTEKVQEYYLRLNNKLNRDIFAIKRYVRRTSDKRILG